ncbi:Ubiquitin carboxyl-terminal hydrolase-like domain [Phaffia rhodozyma]|uniref:Ubiquitin carboxyl-terminal hydrolase-like domain n=1 Tax=Phaffia rhodozyma TaxID=264483 RepID=A0A0F7SM61_PHARH|nr:Ubiquitin carboxyl-terminal hydrolase-like domain [Phaffia rhodozyma]
MSQLVEFGIDPVKAAFSLRKFNGNTEQAADWAFTAGFDWVPTSEPSPPVGPQPFVPPVTADANTGGTEGSTGNSQAIQATRIAPYNPSNQSSVIDHTAQTDLPPIPGLLDDENDEDSDMSKAIRLSIEEANKTNRPADTANIYPDYSKTVGRISQNESKWQENSDTTQTSTNKPILGVENRQIEGLIEASREKYGMGVGGVDGRALADSLALVRTQIESRGTESVVSKEDEHLSQVLEASLHTSNQQSSVTPTPGPNIPRPAGHPVALWSSIPYLGPDVSVLQALSVIPQLSNLLESVESSEELPTCLILLKALKEAMDDPTISYLDSDVLVNLVGVFSGSYGSESPVRRAEEFFTTFVTKWNSEVPSLTCTQPDRLASSFTDPSFQSADLVRVFNYTGSPLLPSSSPPETFDSPHVFPIDGKAYTSLSQAMASILWEADIPVGLETCSEVLCVTVSYLSNQVASGAADAGENKLFKIDGDFWIDRFLSRNKLLSAQLRAEEGLLKGREEELKKRLENLKSVKGKDSRKSLVAVIKYYDELALKSTSDEQKFESGRKSVEKLRTMLKEFDRETSEVASQLEKITLARTNLFDRSELKRCKYSLRAINFHNGIRGPGSLYTYVQGPDKRWFKVVDGVSSEISAETAFADPTGFHLGAGPYMLWYSKDGPWPVEPKPEPDPVVQEEINEKEEIQDKPLIDLDVDMDVNTNPGSSNSTPDTPTAPIP